MCQPDAAVSGDPQRCGPVCLGVARATLRAVERASPGIVRAVAVLWIAAAACSHDAYPARAWPEADRVFRQDPRWLGADAAYSVPLDDDRILWLFGDTFVATSPAHVRAESTMVRNTVGVQRGADPVTASMVYHWRGGDAAPASFFPEDGDRWYWPSHGVRLDRALVLFVQRVRSKPDHALGFEAEGWRAVIVDDASGEPPEWQLRVVAASGAPPGITVGAAVVDLGDHVLALAIREPGDHAGFLVRWRREVLLSGDLDAAEWWAGGRGWVAQRDLGGAPSAVLRDAGPESSLHFDPARRRWLHVRSDGFGATDIVVAEADAPQGPWSEPRIVFRPPESDRDGVLVYAAKAHPEIAASGGLAITYASNTLGDFGRLVRDTSLYWPRFVVLPP